MSTIHRAAIATKLIQANPQNKAELEALKRRIAREYRIPFPDNVTLLAALKDAGNGIPDSLKNLLRVRPVRSLSGIVNVSVLTKPYPCPGNCLYCPNEPGFPKSYLSGEPAAERARFLKFNPYIQVKRRLENLAAEGHNVDKIELRVIGGTWSYYPKAYQEKFIAACFSAGNDFGRLKNKILPLAVEQKRNENAKCRIVGISIETRPDYIDKKEIVRLRMLGVTRVELGIQSIYDDVLKLNNRGHNIDAVVHATQLLKDAGFKVSYQIMLNLYGSSPERDLSMAKEIFSNPDFCPDLLKIYPCAVLKEAPLHQLYVQGKYKPYPDEKVVLAIKEIKKIVPEWVRIERIIRDIPSPRITSGTKEISNLRQMIAHDMTAEGWSCQCIRCREIKGSYDPKERIILVRRDYEASGGKEIFLSFENKNKTKLFSLLRLRIPGGNANPVFPALKGAALIREIHTYGIQTGVGQKSISAQHTGLGKKLIKEAETIAKNEFGIKKIAAIAGIGARAYWRKNGYKLQSSYMVRKI
ncbi:MAG: tRNA uridine(34) 5-carboxymethylaminomethyl modification radical SAM/GNAT enzyme Elp3 [Candidatus Pacebacteria bacterium]|jgi:elongator complex protein 3|nr:tRNA uridine(34) 5-carboxymethylaminomethyl modification radical SAM/GNAT enzyme Elp3 [Candidatus Paceibacterota bacterium]